MASGTDGPDETLLDREAPRAALAALLCAARAGRGGALLVVAPAGLGKSALLRAARRDALAAGFDVRVARGERFGAKPWAAGRALLGQGAGKASAAGALDAVLGAARERPALLVVDDAGWLDAASARFLVALLGRLEEAPIAVLLAARPSASATAGGPVDHVLGHPAVRRIRLEPLSPPAVAALLAADATDADADADVLAAAIARESAGHPLLAARMCELAAGERRAGRRFDPARLGALAADALRGATELWLAGAGPDAAPVASAAAVLGEEATLRRVALLLERDAEPVSAALAGLAREGLVAPGEPVRFAQPVVARIAREGAPAALHAGAARLLDGDGLGARRVAAHLLHAPRRADPWAAARLRAAAAAAARDADPAAALAFAQRALDEPPPPAERAGAVADLARAQAATGDPEAGRTFETALDHLDDPGERALLRRDQGRWLFARGHRRDAARAFAQGRDELPPGDPLHPELRAAYLGAAQFDVELRPLVDDELHDLLEADESGRGPAERALLAQLAFQQTFAAAPREQVRRLCDRAWGGEVLLADEGPDGDAWTLVCGSLYWIGDLERALEVVAAARDAAERVGSPLGRATAAWASAPPLLHQGYVTAALARAEQAIAARRIGWARHLGSLHRVHARCLIERGELDAAEATLAAVMDEPDLRHSSERTVLLEARGRLRLLRGDAVGALADFEAAGERALQGSYAELPTVIAWRSSAALARHALGDRDEALALLAAELALAERAGVDRAISTALRIRGLVEGGEAGIASLRAAVDAMPEGLPRLERTHALLELGAALRRAGHRRDSEPPLRAALAAAQAGGATVAAESARTELAALGARARRVRSVGGDVLTPSERRVARLAAEGRPNRSIAQELHVSPKTVEYHLRHVFAKLGVARRTELAGVLEAADTP